MKRPVEFAGYRDKVMGCWLGKCIAGTLGAPYEGMKQRMDLRFDPSLVETMLPNDDLDLQVLWLHVLEQKGPYFSSDDLAEAFATRCPYAPGEYAIFKKNYRRGLRPPYCGAFNNSYYVEGMGCPIRSEIWACIAPGDPDLAALCAAQDGVLDHAGNSVYAEQFLAAAEALAFVEPNLEACLDRATSYLPADSRIYRLVRDTRAWCGRFDDWPDTHERIVRHYGHPDCTNLFQNIGITLMALYYGRGEFLDTAMIALNGGFDTDCTCATAGALLGIHLGASALGSRYGFGDPGYVLGVQVERRSDRLADLADDTCRVGLAFAPLNRAVELVNAPPAPSIVAAPVNKVTLRVRYDGLPAVGLGETRTVRLLLENHSEETVRGELRFDLPAKWTASPSLVELTLRPKSLHPVEAIVEAPAELDQLAESNRVVARFTATDGTEYRHEFGLVGAAVWKAFGPFWENNVTVPPLKPRESYFGYVSAGANNEVETLDRVRDYHLNAFTDPTREYLSLEEIRAGDGRLVNTYEDRFSVGDIVGWQGPCTVYLLRKLVSPADRAVYLQIGHSDAFRLWINGELVANRDTFGWWTNENVHVAGVPLRQGENEIVVKLVRRSQEAYFSLVFSEGGTCVNHYDDFASLNPGTAQAR